MLEFQYQIGSFEDIHWGVGKQVDLDDIGRLSGARDFGGIFQIDELARDNESRANGWYDYLNTEFEYIFFRQDPIISDLIAVVFDPRSVGVKEVRNIVRRVDCSGRVKVIGANCVPDFGLKFNEFLAGGVNCSDIYQAEDEIGREDARLYAGVLKNVWGAYGLTRLERVVEHGCTSDAGS